jgi:putative ABC transport system permease protein
MKLLKLSLRNVLRNKRRTLITLVSIVTAMVAIIVFGGFIEFTFQGLRETTIRTQLGHFQVTRQGYDAGGTASPQDFLIEDPDGIERRLRGLPHVETVTRRLSASGLASTGQRTLSARIVGVMPEREEAFAAFETIVRGQQLDRDTPEGGVIGNELAKSLDAKVGDTVTLLTTTVDGVVNAVDFEVVGIARTGSREYDSVFVKLPLPLVQRLLDTRAVEKVIVLLDETERIAEAEPALARLVTDGDAALEYRRWDELAEFYRGVVNLYTGIFNLVSVILAIVVLFSIANTMGMSVFERVREIGTLRAIGETRAGVMRLFLAEGMVIGVLGGVVGLAAAAAISHAINAGGGIAIGAPPGMSRGYTAYILLVPEVLSHSFLLTLAVSTVSALYPAWVAARLEIIEALQHT